MPKITQKTADERRAQIVAAAQRVFASKGLSRATLRDVFQEAGMSAGAVYNYYQTKDDLVLAVTEAGMAQALAAMAETSSPEPDLASVVEGFLSALARSQPSDAPRVDLMIAAEALASPAVQLAVVANRERVLQALVRLVERRQQKDGVFQGHSAQALAELLYATYQGLIVSVALGEQPDVTGIGKALKAIRLA